MRSTPMPNVKETTGPRPDSVATEEVVRNLRERVEQLELAVKKLESRGQSKSKMDTAREVVDTGG